MSAYTGLSCTFSYLIREHGSEKVYDWIFEAAQQAAKKEEPDFHLSDALSYLAAAVVSNEVSEAESKVPEVARFLKNKIEETQTAYDELVAAADLIKFNDLEFSDYLEEIEHPLARLSRPRFSTPQQPVRSIRKKIEEFQGAEKTEYQWISVDKFMTEEFPSIIELQINLYKDFTTYSSHREDDHPANWKASPFAYLRVKKGQLYRLLGLKSLYKETADQLQIIKELAAKFKAAVSSEQAAHNEYDKARSAIEQKIPDDLGRHIPYDVIESIRNKAPKP
ncbi:hypothetical protein [Pseudomonas simiae]|uniref:Uncharacterized protein n=2 Tax=Pseudomonas TaxID=286 RepID=A0ABS9GAV1_9PSED|nr:hypothetical protein [Pseudomonas simiae]MCF5188319.1 hypothetical protein [Pseudomonas simiae]MCF5288681.1 hypothetical protein [Pseudomonas simiae]MCF5320663.1 hypothetical protein [Pseudomonas simiae]MCF5337722.1 hypothetical protein [Pseudomonas simiae]MCF5343130.1 hypothetical protein [Pseudomonas simiae]